MQCRNCQQVVDTVCAEHGACLPCHELELRHLVRERDNAYDYLAMQQQQPQVKQHTWGERNIGSQWYPSDPKDALRDDIERTSTSINKFLGYGG